MITRNEAVSLYGSVAGLAKALGVERQAIYLWGKDKPIPEQRYLQLRYQLKPDAFTAAGSLRAKRRTP